MQWVAYEGTEFTIEWYFDHKGRSQALDYFKSNPKSGNANCLNGIYVFKPQPDRYLCFFVKGKKIIITNAFIKKTDKLPKGEKKQALKAKNNFEERVKQGDYYHEEET